MDKLFLGLSLLCLTWTVSGRPCIKCQKKLPLKDDQTLKCKTCSHMIRTSGCTYGPGICIAKANETCLTEKYFAEGKFQYGRLMCKENCETKTVQRRLEDFWVFECCSGRNFCNNI